MKRLIIPALVLLLLVSNAYWFYAVLDRSVGASYAQDAAAQECHALDQALQLLPALSRTVSQKNVLRIAAQLHPGQEPFEKDGAMWIGWLGFSFDNNQRLAQVTRSWEPKTCE